MSDDFEVKEVNSGAPGQCVPGGNGSSSSCSSDNLPTEIEMTPRSNEMAMEDTETESKSDDYVTQLTNQPIESTTMDLAPVSADSNIELDSLSAPAPTRRTRAPGEAETASAGQDALVFATLTDQSGRQGEAAGRASPLTAEDASSDEPPEWTSTSQEINSGTPALVGLQLELEHKKEALHRLIARASENESQQQAALSDEPVEKREQVLQEERARLRQVLSELGQMSQEMRELNKQLQDAEDTYGRKIQARSREDSSPVSDSQIFKLRQELGDEKQRLFRALADLEDRNGQIEQYRQELDVLTQKQEDEACVMRLQRQLDTERQSASSLASELNSKNDQIGELQEQLRTLLETRKTDQKCIEALEQRLADKAQEFVEIEKNLSDREDQIGELQEQLRSLMNARKCETEQCSKNIETLTAKLNDATEKSSKLTESKQLDSEQHSKQIDALKTQLNDATEQISKLTESKQLDSEQHSKQIDALKTQLSDSAEQIRVLNAAHLEEQRQRQVLEAEQKMNRVQRQDSLLELDNKSSEIVRLKVQVREKEGAFLRAIERCDALLTQMKDLQSQCLSMKALQDAQVACCKELQKLLDQKMKAKDQSNLELESELRALSLDIDCLRTENSMLHDTVKEESMHQRAMEDQLESERLSSITLTNELNAKVDQVKDLSKQLSSALEALCAAETRMQKKADELEAERCKLADAMAKLKEMDATVESLQAKIDTLKLAEHWTKTETHTQTSLVGIATDAEQNSLEEKSNEIGSLNDKINLMNLEKQNVLAAFELVAKELQERKTEVELFLAKLDNLKARNSYCHSVMMEAAKLNCSRCSSGGLPLGSACCSVFSPIGSVANRPMLHPACRLLIERRIALLESRSDQLGEPSSIIEGFDYSCKTRMTAASSTSSESNVQNQRKASSNESEN